MLTVEHSTGGLGLGGGGLAVSGDDGCHCFSISTYGDLSICPGPPLALCIPLKPIKTNTLMGSHSLSLLLCSVSAHLPLFPLTRRT